MTSTEPLLPCEKLLFHSDLVKIGRFDCPAESSWFRETAPMNNHLFVITRKPLWWRRAEGQFRFAEPGAALFHQAGGEVQRRNVGENGDQSDWFGIREDLFREALSRHNLDFEAVTQRPTLALTRVPVRLQEHRLLRALENGRPRALAVEEACLALLDSVCREFSGRPPGSPARDGTRIRRRKLTDRARYVLDQETENPSLSALADHLGVSVFHLCRVFRQETGLTINAYQQRQRIGVALDLMTRSRQDLTTLAHRLGFSSHSHFSRAFKAQLGVPPSLLNGC